MKDNINYEAPEDWGVSSETEWVSHSELTDNGAPALEGQDVVGFVEFAQIKLAPGKPENAMAWRSEDGKPVALNPSTKRWQYVRTQAKPAQRQQQKTQAPIKEDRGSQPSPELEKAADKILAEILSEDTQNQVKELEKRKQPKLDPKQEQREGNKQAYMKEMVGLLIEASTQTKGAGRNTLSREDLETYQSVLNGNRPTIPNREVSEEDVDEVIGMLKDSVGKGKPWTQFINRIKKKGDPPGGMANIARARSVIKFYMQTGGVSAITGKVIPFSDTQLDHRVSLDNGGVDGPDNWEYVEARFNQFKGALTDDAVREEIKKKLSATPDQDKRDALKRELQNVARFSYTDYFKSNGFGSISIEDVKEASGTGGQQMLKAMADAAGISTYPPRKERSTGRGGGGGFIGYPALKQKLLENISLQSRDQIKAIDQKLTDISSDLSKREGEIKEISSKINKEAREARKKAKANMTEADYLELIKLSRNPEYADSMVYYRGKVLGRCPAGTTKSGKTCVPAQKDMKGTKYDKNLLGGLSKKQVARLSKAKNVEQIMEAHKEKEEKDTKND